jgi:16S rRNA (guanine527-N7)-methyltransferase
MRRCAPAGQSPAPRTERLRPGKSLKGDILERWLAAVLETPGLTALKDPAEARRVLLDDALAGLELVRRFDGAIVDVGSGGGTPGIPLAASLPDRAVTLLEAERRKTEFLLQWTEELPNLDVVWGRAEEQSVETYGVAVAKALAPPPVAAEWCLPLVREGGAAILWVGPSADADAVSRAAERLAGALEESPPGFFVLRKIGPTPSGFPRRTGMAKKRPLA